MITLTCINCSLFVDIDECTRGTHNCHSSLASCTNTVGSFSCSCSNPYIGDGKTCINIPHGNYYHQELGCLFSLDPYLHSLEACYFNLDCLKRVSVKCKCYPDLLSTNPKARSGQLIKFNSPLYQPLKLPRKYMYCGSDMSIVISARYGVCNSFFTKSFSGLFPFCLTHYDARIRASIMTGFARAKAH